MRDGKYDLANEQVVAVLKRAPNSGMANYLRAVMQFAQGHYKEASVSAQKVTTVAPDYLPAILLNASIQYQTGALLQAEANAQRYVKALPAWLPGRKLLAAIYIKEAKPAEAMTVLEPVLDQSRDHRPAGLRAGGRRDGAARQLGARGRISRESDEPESEGRHDQHRVRRRQISSTATSTAPSARSSRCCRPIRATPITDTMLMLGYMSKKEFAKGIELGQRLTAADPKNPTFFNLLGGAYAGNGELDRAQRRVRGSHPPGPGPRTGRDEPGTDGARGEAAGRREEVAAPDR